MKAIHTLSSLLLGLALAAPAAAQTYQLTEVGPTCGADLRGQVVSSPAGSGVRLGLRSVVDNGLAVLAIGSRRPTPVQLPGGQCDLYVDPRATQLQRTGPRGHARFAFRIPPVVPIRIAFQAVVLDVRPTGLRAASSDVIILQGQ